MKFPHVTFTMTTLGEPNMVSKILREKKGGQKGVQKVEFSEEVEEEEISDTNSVVGDKTSVVGDTNNVVGDTNNVVGHKAHVTHHTDNVAGDLTHHIDNVGGDKTNVVGHTDNVGGHIKDVVGDKAHVVGDKSSVAHDISNVGGDKSSLTHDISNVGGHKDNVVGEKNHVSDSPLPSVPMSIAERSIADMSRPPLHASPWRVFLTLFAEKGGLDKTIKLIQYTGRLLLWAAKQGWFTRHRQLVLLWQLTDLESRLNGMVSNFSQFRKIIKLGEWMGPVEDLLTTKHTLTSLGLQAEIMEVINTIGDDIYCLSKIGVVKGKRLGRNGELMANWGWYGAIFINIKVGIETYRLAVKSGDEEKIWDAKLTLFKLANDFVFCTIDCLEPEGLSNVYQTVTGLASGGVGFYKLWKKIAKKLDKELEEKERCS